MQPSSALHLCRPGLYVSFLDGLISFILGKFFFSLEPKHLSSSCIIVLRIWAIIFIGKVFIIFETESLILTSVYRGHNVDRRPDDRL